jgi:hypothetical protein
LVGLGWLGWVGLGWVGWVGLGGLGWVGVKIFGFGLNVKLPHHPVVHTIPGGLCLAHQRV